MLLRLCQRWGKIRIFGRHPYSKWQSRNSQYIFHRTLGAPLTFATTAWGARKPDGHLQPWTSAEEERLWKLYKDGVNARRLSELLDRTYSAVQNRLQVVRKGKRTTTPRFKPWTSSELSRDSHRQYWTSAEEERLLKLHEDGLNARQISELLDRTYSAVLNHLQVVRKGKRTTTPRLKPWTPSELSRLQELRHQGQSRSLIAESLGRTLPSVNYAVEKVDQTRKRWTAEETKTLETMQAASHTHEQIAVALQRSTTSVYNRARRLAHVSSPAILPRWKQQVLALKSAGKTWKGIQQLMPHRSLFGITQMYKDYVSMNGVSVHKSGTLWSRDEIEKLRVLWSSGMQQRQIARQIGRSRHSITKAVCHHLTNPWRAKRGPWSEEEYVALIKLRGEGKTWNQIAAILGRTSRACSAKSYSTPASINASLTRPTEQ